MEPDETIDETPFISQRIKSQSYAIMYAAMLPYLVRIGRKHGYAIAVHGSMATDFDLIAVPWTETASQPKELIEAIKEWLNLRYTIQSSELPIAKPHGRLAWSLVFNAAGLDTLSGPYIDISVMSMLPEISYAEYLDKDS